jgi:hypothetical protein
MKGIVVFAAALAACLLAGCDDPGRTQRDAETAKKQREAAERSVRYKAKREAEAALFADPKTAEDAINTRIDEWVTRKGGLLLIRGEWSESQQPKRAKLPWYSMPSTVSWYISCGTDGVSVTLGNWLDTSGEADRVRTDNVFGITVTFTPLSDEQCQHLVVAAGKKMLTITPAGEYP